MASEYHVGSVVTVSCTFTDRDTSVAVDPTAVFVEYTNPAGTKVSKQYGVDVAVVRTATGAYKIDIPVSTAGTWYAEWYSTGNAQAANSTLFVVTESYVPG